MMTEPEAAKERPAVSLNQLNHTASFVFLGHFYELPGKYFSIGEANKAAEEKCREIGRIR
ncbi:hypothetical protein [Pseudorhizobium marinum]|uniref:hypothetical protein n=1 Tax=Pseudorhizobium marinum TaxID=1496690 RepID=UPI0004963399|nr:hypothetical protein [Pseudorhizobium marinum]